MRDFNIPGRSAAIAANGMAATSHPMATLAALDVLRSGGNAADAAIAAVAMQCVVEPESTGIGGDCFVLYSRRGAVPVALNGSGRAPAKATVDWYVERGIGEIGIQTPHAVTIPGAIDAWCVFNREYGSRPLVELLEPAARAAEDGYVVTPRVAADWSRAEYKLRNPVTAALFLPGGKPPEVGDKMRNPPLAATLRRIARDGREAFYNGPVMREIVARLKSLGGLHEEADFAAQRSNWVEPIHASYRGYEVYECPPNGQGMAALMILRALAGYTLDGDAFSEADRLHLLAEASKAAYWVRDNFICDPEHVPVDVADFLSESRAERARRTIRLDHAMPGPRWAEIEHKDTVYLCTVDRDGNACSFINSLFSSFGTGILAPECGVLLHNRGTGFRTIPGHPNAIAPHKRPLHTIIPGMLVKDGQAVMPFGVMGGHYQAVGHAHFIHRLLDRGMDPQQAAEQPRILPLNGVLQVERANPEPIIADLAHRGHEILMIDVPLGGCQAIWMDHQRGVLVGGSEPRKDGLALGY
ncbi:MAG: gamma-glutamyltransferase family protein [Alphaproteobacteria bacterium]|nr:gamma-glutamyltransferase family protein [Alphaproteobacteria bacterium]